MKELIHKINITVVARYPVGGIRTFMKYVYTKFHHERFKFTFILPESLELPALKKDLEGLHADWIVLKKHYPIKDFFFEGFSHFKKANIIHAHGYTALVYTTMLNGLTQKPVFFTGHDMFNRKQFVGIRGRLKKFVLGYALKRADIIQCVSFDALDNLTTFFPELNKIQNRLVVIPNGIETNIFLIEDKKDWRSALGLDSDSFLIGFLGRFMAPKGFKVLIDAMEILSRKELSFQPVVLAFGGGGFIREDRAEIRKRGLDRYFRFIPFQANPGRAMRGVDVIVMPSLWEACGLLAMEALVAGTPLIGTDCVGLREVLRDTPARVIPKADSKALADAIFQEANHPSKRIFKDFRQEAAERFDVKLQADKIAKLLEGLALRRP